VLSGDLTGEHTALKSLKICHLDESTKQSWREMISIDLVRFSVLDSNCQARREIDDGVLVGNTGAAQRQRIWKSK
jgi:hypothetical protein